MSAIDHCEEETIRAFQKGGWHVRDKPFFIRVTDGNLRADVSFERRGNDQFEQIIVVEIKCFTDFQRDLVEFYKAVGQYQTYRAALRLNDLPAGLYLTIPQDAYHRFEKRPEFMETLRDARINYVIIDLEHEEIVQWMP